MVHHNECPLCSSAELTFYLKCTDHFISKEEFDLYKCLSCNFIFTQDYPGENDIGKYYESEDYISHSDTSKGLANKIYHLARNFMIKKKIKIILDVTGLQNGNLLDIGSGTGHFAHYMNKAGWQVKGIEININAINFATLKFGLEIFSNDQISNLPSESFDCITLWHVLEHFHDPYFYASQIIRLLKPGGTCLIALPNCNSYDAGFYLKYWAAYDVPRHLWHFNPATFKVFTERTGFIIEETIDMPLDLFYISILSEKYQRKSHYFLRGIIKAFLFTLKLLSNKDRSSSITYVLKKRPV